MTRKEFNDALKLADDHSKRIRFVQKFLFHGTPHVFNERENDYFEFRTEIANKFDVGFHEVFIVGSAKLGFSFHKKKDFDYDSDIDVVIVNEKLFEEFYSKISDYQYQLDKHHRTVNMKEKELYNEFLQYLVKGWMRPDKLPISFQVGELKRNWLDYFNSLSNGKSTVGNYKVRAGLFKNRTYLEKYYVSSVNNTRATLVTN